MQRIVGLSSYPLQEVFSLRANNFLSVAETPRYRAEGARLKSARKLLGLTQERFAADLAASLATVKSWERGNSLPNRTLAAKVAKRGINMDYVITGQGDPLIPPERKAAWDRMVDRTLQEQGQVVMEPMQQLRSSTHALTALCQQLDFTPPVHWMILVQELMLLDGLSERGARRILETLKAERT